MKKIISLVVLGLILLNATMLVAAGPAVDLKSGFSDVLIAEDSTYQKKNEKPEISAGEKPTITQGYPRRLLRKQSAVQNNEELKGVKIKGIWGYQDDNETQGYVGGIIRRQGRCSQFFGRWNTTDSEELGKIGGYLRFGYFVGRIETPEGERFHIMGLYKIDQENHLIKMRWMTPGNTGWTVCKYLLPSSEE